MSRVYFTPKEKLIMKKVLEEAMEIAEVVKATMLVKIEKAIEKEEAKRVAKEASK